MKSPICRLAQSRINPDHPRSGWLAGHLESCPDCRDYLQGLESLEAQLKSPPAEYDAKRCSEIMGLLQNESIVATSPNPVDPEVSQWGLKFGLAAALAFGVTFLALWEPKGNEVVENSGSGDALVKNEAPTDGVSDNPAQALATLLQQQEFLRRDARKLGAHLQERVILFRAVEQ